MKAFKVAMVLIGVLVSFVLTAFLSFVLGIGVETSEIKASCEDQTAITWLSGKGYQCAPIQLRAPDQEEPKARGA